MDDFNKDLALAEKTRDQILNGLEQRANKNRMGETDALLDTRLKG